MVKPLLYLSSRGQNEKEATEKFKEISEAYDVLSGVFYSSSVPDVERL